MAHFLFLLIVEPTMLESKPGKHGANGDEYENNEHGTNTNAKDKDTDKKP